MHDAHAASEVENARSVQAAAEQTIEDLAVALPAAEAELARAEKAAESARHELAKLHGEKLMRARVVAAARMDAAFAESAAAYEDFSRLGRELQNFPDLNIGVSGNISHWESVTGYRRIAAALPAFFTKLFPGTFTIEGARGSLPPEKKSSGNYSRKKARRRRRREMKFVARHQPAASTTPGELRSVRAGRNLPARPRSGAPAGPFLRMRN
jgi:hypothetical protein